MKSLPGPLEVIAGLGVVGTGIAWAVVSGPEDARRLADAASLKQYAVAAAPYILYAALVAGGIGSVVKGVKDCLVQK